ncbi:MAG: hypothetical protein ACPG8W_01220 [Candidatus Promineifilaceae bacterium]
MHYRHAPQRDYSDFASGRVILSAPNHAAYPVRLASEIFQRCLVWLDGVGKQEPVTIYDPCCGAASHLTALGLLHGDRIGRIVASDIDANTLATAAQNLALLQSGGMQQRLAKIEQMLTSFGKESHRAAMMSANRFLAQLEQREQQRPITVDLFQADALMSAPVPNRLQPCSVDVVFCDVPHGQLVTWQGFAQADAPPLGSMLDALQEKLRCGSLVAISADKRQKITHTAYQRLEKFKVGKRQIAILRLNETQT